MKDAAAHSLPPETRIAGVELLVGDLERTVAFYERLIGLRPVGSFGRSVAMASEGQQVPPVVLVEEKGTVAIQRPAPGLYHLALKFGQRTELAHTVGRLLHHGYPLHGAADHFVSEAIYLADPEGNGVELYCDRPKDAWSWNNGQVEMGTEPLDIEGLLAEGAEDDAGDRDTTDIKLGHVHLKVSDLARSGRFYHEALGFDITQKGYPGALFLSAGGYHHHIGLNVWHTRGAQPAPEGTAGLISFAVAVPGLKALHDLRNRIELLKMDTEDTAIPGLGEGFMIRDPDGIAVEIGASTEGM